MKATDFVKGKKYVTDKGDILEFSHLDAEGDPLFFDNNSGIWKVDGYGLIGFYWNADRARESQWKEYVDTTGVNLDHLPDGITRDQLLVHKYAVGDKMAKAQGLTIDHFEPGIQAIKWSKNPNEKSKFLHCHGFNKLSGQFTFFVCKLKTEK